jgi:guanine deaminase
VQLDSSRCDKAIRASFLHFNDDPDKSSDSWEYVEDGLLILKLGHVIALGKADD